MLGARSGRWLRVAAIAATVLPTAAATPLALATDFSEAMQQALATRQLPATALAQPLADVMQAPELTRRFLSDPPAAWRRVDAMRLWPAWRGQPGELYHRLTAEAGAAPSPGDQPPTPPVAASPVPVPATVPEPVARALRRGLHGRALAEAWRAQALAGWPPELTPRAVLAQTIPAAAALANVPDPGAAPAWPDIDRHALRTGMRILMATAEQLHAFVTTTPDLPPVVWRTETPWGTVLVDTTGQDNHHRR